MTPSPSPDADDATVPCAVLDPGLQAAQANLEGFLAGIERRAFRFAELSLGDREDALDCIQESMIKLMTYREHPAKEWTPLFWRILRSRIIDTQRRRLFRLRWLAPATQYEDGASVDWADDGPGPERRQDNREAWTLLAQALRRLPRRQREAFSLRVLEDLDGATTARIMGCSEGSIKTHLSRAREALQRQLQDFAPP